MLGTQTEIIIRRDFYSLTSFFLIFVAFWSFTVGVAWLSYITFTDVTERRDFTVIFPIFQGATLICRFFTVIFLQL